MEKITRVRIFWLNAGERSPKFLSYHLKNILAFGEVNISRRFSFAAPQSDLAIIKALEKSPIKRKTQSFTIPPLTEDHLKEVSSISGILIGLSYISWVKFLIHPTLMIVDWNSKPLPDDFRSKASEPDILKYAYQVKQTLPQSDLYVMETFSIRGKELNERVNEIHLSSMLIVLLNGLNREPEYKDKVVFQRKNVLNHLYDLLIGSERVSSRTMAESILNQIRVNSDLKKSQEKVGEKEHSTFLCSAAIIPKCLDVYKESSFEKKEDLSTVLLLASSFIDINIIKNQESVDKINRKKRKSVVR